MRAPREARRGRAKRTLQPLRVVGALIVRDGQVLICRRSRHQAMPLKWEFPGGKIEPGESAETALVRELDEELGIVAEIGPAVRNIRHRYGSGLTVELQFFRVERYSGELQNRVFEQIAWARPWDISQYDFLEADAPLVTDIAAGKIF
jgi:8-oxo-dGTP diphosphatase